VSSSWFLNILIYSSCDVVFNCTLEIMFLSKQLLMTWMAIASLSSHSAILHALIVGKIVAIATIWTTIGAMGFVYVPLT
jgi:flagellar biosynthesis protein FliQ